MSAAATSPPRPRLLTSMPDKAQLYPTQVAAAAASVGITVWETAITEAFRLQRPPLIPPPVRPQEAGQLVPLP